MTRRELDESLKRVLNIVLFELKAMREEMNGRFTNIDKRFDRIESRLDRQGGVDPVGCEDIARV